MVLQPLKLPRPVLIGLRVVVGLIFVAMGSWKIGSAAGDYQMGGRIGDLFNVLATVEMWWALIGWSQVVAGALLITQRFATVGALVLAGVTVNIVAVNLSFWPEFATTMSLTAFALVGLALLLLHDLDRWQYVFWKRPPVLASRPAPPESPLQPDPKRPRS